MQTLDNFIEGFLIGTKRNANGWKVSKQTLPMIVNAFIGKPFTIIPEKIAHNIDTHFHGATKQETIDGYNAYSHGTIEKIIGPFPYNDGTDDFYYKHITRLSNSKSASLLAEWGAKTKIPFSVSPHIWHEDAEITDYVHNFTPIGISLVNEGAYGSIAVINQLCQGTADNCHRSLGACNNNNNSSCGCCANTDENIVNILSSHFSKSASVPTIMSVNTSTSTENTTPFNAVPSQPINNANQPTQQLTQEPTASDKIILTKEQYDIMQQERKEFESTKSRLAILEDTHKTSVLNNIFTADLVTDETTRNNLVEKWKKFDVVIVQDLYQDFTASLVPAFIEKARKDAETAAALVAANAATQTPIATNKSKSAALKPEPKISEEDKTTSELEPAKVNEVALLRKYLFLGGRV
jgi:hypothetical protein